MINLKDPPIEQILAPVAIDLEIYKIQQKLSAIPWLQKVFGRARLQPQPPQNKENKGRDQLIPEVYYKREAYPALPNDALRSYCFFYPRDPMTFTSKDSLDLEQLVEQPISIYFWANMLKVDPTKDYDFSDELKKDVFAVLRRCTRFNAVGLYSQYDQIFRPFTLSDTYKQYIKPPYTAFRFDGLLLFDFAAVCAPA